MTGTLIHVVRMMVTMMRHLAVGSKEDDDDDVSYLAFLRSNVRGHIHNILPREFRVRPNLDILDIFGARPRN